MFLYGLSQKKQRIQQSHTKNRILDSKSCLVRHGEKE